jgi:hypothetical protein
MQKFQGFASRGNGDVQTDTPGALIDAMAAFPGCTVTVYNHGTSNLATIYSDESLTPKANPFTSATDAFWFFYGVSSVYDVRFSGTGISAPYTLTDIGSSQGGSDLGWFNVKDYGATGDGSTNDSAFIQAAIDACHAYGGGVVYFPFGDYHLDAALSLLDMNNITLRGCGWGSRLTASSLLTHGTLGVAAVWGLIYADSTTSTCTENIVIENLAIEYGVGNYSQDQKTIFYGLVNNFTLRNCYINGGYWESVYHHGATVSGTYYDCQNTSIVNNTFGPDGLSEQVATNSRPQNGVFVTGNYFNQCIGNVISVRGQNMLIANNILYRCRAWGIAIGERDSPQDGVIVANNIIVEQGYGGTGGAIAIRVMHGITATQVASTTLQATIVANNSILNMVSGAVATKAIQIDGNAIVAGNIISGVTGTGTPTAIYIDAIDGLGTVNQQIVMCGNVVQDTSNTLKWRSGISVVADDNGEHIIIRMQNNYIGDVESGYFAFLVGNGATKPCVYFNGDIMNGVILTRKGTITGNINGAGELNNVPIIGNTEGLPSFFDINQPALSATPSATDISTALHALGYVS